MTVSDDVACDADPFAAEALADPYPLYARLRALGPAVRLTRHGAWALARHREVWRALREPDVFSSAVGGLGLRALQRRLAPIILWSDPPRHARYRAILDAQLSARVVRELRATIAAQADALVAAAIARGRVDAVAEIAARLPVAVVGDLLGLPRAGRERLLELADAVSNSFGPPLDPAVRAARPRVEEFLGYLATAAGPRAVAPDSWGAAIYAAAGRGALDEGEASALMAAYLVGGMASTVHAIGSAIWLLARHPAQWSALRADPALAGAAFEETLRLESPAQVFPRVLARDCELGGVSLRRGERLLLLLGSANRDERRWTRPDAFDIARPTAGHVAFGGGVHRCQGHALARLEGTAVLAALARRAESIELTAPPRRRRHHALRGFEHLDVRIATRGSAG